MQNAHSVEQQIRESRRRALMNGAMLSSNWHIRLRHHVSSYMSITVLFVTGIYVVAQVALMRVTAVNELTSAAATSQSIERINPSVITLDAAGTQLVPPISASPITRMSVPAINLDAPVLQVGWMQNPVTALQEWTVARYAVGHHYLSGLPGEGTNIVFSSHVAGYGKLFANLDKLLPGELITLYEGDIEHSYTVTSQVLIPAEGPTPEEQIANLKLLDPTNHEQLTLITCWPATGPDKYSQRLVVIAEPIK
jgi:LPXTG-site transpeptidase (sortase) family protein